ncbi:carbohydrate esterase family 12 protein [Aaosphaeria arxii CBS 175.79]|uniref:Carbohydrate esterase family 12 protein n=1 Tax=Aaosphaeria arxii CBS 175.79 TaxID=1450172 RepID=A0A6A5Y2L5_9PLEO|nr:carbohydrate esterase family 12 protein [Aaosphaeria arxii CBS 175.79]KAF2019805.1 carbohydrate esterase family 12 protein [Aaosphaeria arxii CBS 175.79]
MRFYLLSVLASLAAASPLAVQADRPVYWLLAGDSTTAPNGGWGDGYLATTVASGSSGHNYGHSGATTASFRAGGDWGKVINDIKKYKEKYDVWVTIQFGHNDQKETSGVTLDAYKTNLKKFADEAKSAGATPVLLTPLTRRTFSNGKVIQNLAEQRTATISVAQSNSIKFADLNIASENYVNAIGKDAASKYNLASNDWTHLNERGGVVFARIVSDIILEKYPELDSVVKKDPTLSQTIKSGKPA